jgi:hypothetical protein
MHPIKLAYVLLGHAVATATDQAAHDSVFVAVINLARAVRLALHALAGPGRRAQVVPVPGARAWINGLSTWTWLSRLPFRSRILFRRSEKPSQLGDLPGGQRRRFIDDPLYVLLVSALLRSSGEPPGLLLKRALSPARFDLGGCRQHP